MCNRLFGAVSQRRVLQVQHDGLIGVGEDPVQHHPFAVRLGAVETHGQQVEERVQRQRGQRVGGYAGAAGQLRRPIAQFVRGEQVGVAPGGGLREITELFVGVGRKVAGLRVGGIGKHQLVGDLGDRTSRGDHQRGGGVAEVVGVKALGEVVLLQPVNMSQYR